MHTAFLPAGDVRLYRETPAAVTSKGRGGKARGAKAKPPPAGAWDLLADSVEALREAGEKLRRNKQRPEQRLASQVRWPWDQVEGEVHGALSFHIASRALQEASAAKKSRVPSTALVSQIRCQCRCRDSQTFMMFPPIGEDKGTKMCLYC